MAKFTKRSDSKQQKEKAPRLQEDKLSEPREQDSSKEAADAYIKSLIEAYADERTEEAGPSAGETSDETTIAGEAPAAEEQTEEKQVQQDAAGEQEKSPAGETQSEAPSGRRLRRRKSKPVKPAEVHHDDAGAAALAEGGEQELPPTESDVIRYFNDPEEYKYEQEKRAAGIRKGRARVFFRSGEVELMPESDPGVPHRIHSAQLEHSEPGEEPTEGKFADETQPSAQEQPADGATRKFIKADPLQPKEEPEEIFSPAESEAPQRKPRRSRLFANLLSEDDLPLRYPEYTGREDEKKIREFLIRYKKSAVIKLAISAGALLLSLLFSLIPVFQSIGDTERTLHLFGGNGLAYGIVMLLLFVVGIAPLINEFSDGIALLLRKKAGSSTALLLLWIAVLLQNLVLLLMPEKIYTQCFLYNTAALALTDLVFLFRLSAITRTTASFRSLISGHSHCAITHVNDAHRSEKIGQGILEPDAKIYYRSKLPGMDKFINSSLGDDPTVGICSVLLPVCLGVAFLVFLVMAIVTKDIGAAVTGFTAVILATSPLSVGIALKGLLDSFNRSVAQDKGAIPGYSTAVAFASADAIIFDASELYDVDSLQVDGAKTFHEHQLYDVILQAAALFIESDSPLSGTFRRVIADRTELLPPVEMLIYEDRQGLSAWVGNKKILAGTRDMMINHNIETPPTALEEKYLRGDENRRIIYLAVDGELAAMFVVGYSLNPAVRKNLAYLVRHGFTILLRSTDPHINDEMVETQASLAADTIKVINTEAAEYFKMCRQEEALRVQTCLFSDNRFISSLRLMSAAVRLRNALDLTTPFAVITSVLGLLLISVLMIFSGAGAVAGWHLFLMQLLWIGIGSFACRILAKK